MPTYTPIIITSCTFKNTYIGDKFHAITITMNTKINITITMITKITITIFTTLAITTTTSKYIIK